MKILLRICFALLVTAFSAAAATYYVAITGLDANPGTQAQPWLTVQKGANTAVAGDTVLVEAGTYTEDVTTTSSGVATNRITFNGQQAATLRRFAIEHAYTTLTGFTLNGPATVGSSAIFLDEGAHYALVTNNVLDLQQQIGVNGIAMETEVYTNPGDTNAPRHCSIISNYVGNVFGATAILIGGRFNSIRLNTVTNIYTADFTRLFGHTNLILNNRFLNNIFQAGSGNHPDFTQTFGENNQASLGHVIDGNIVSNIVSGQLCQLTMVNSFLDGQHGWWIFRNNVFADIALQASVGIPGTQWLNNDFLRCNQDGHVLTMGYLTNRSDARDTVILNNVFLDCGRTNSDVTGWYGREATVTNLTADYNFVSKLGYNPVRQEDPPSAFRWYEPNGINGGDPRFVNEAILDLHLLADSPLLNRGATIASFAHDFELKTRPRGPAWDIGAFEFEGPVTAPVLNSAALAFDLDSPNTFYLWNGAGWW